MKVFELGGVIVQQMRPPEGASFAWPIPQYVWLLCDLEQL
jgi:hypothetical protein